MDIKEPECQKPCSLNSLPSDCWMIILEFLEPQDIYPASLSCGVLYRFLQPLVYQTISLEWNTISLTHILRLLRSILQKPELASYVQHVSFVSSPEAVYMQEWKNIRPELNWKEEAANYMDVIDQAQTIVRKADFTAASGSDWIQALQDGNAYAFAAVIISQLHNLQTLRLDFSFVWNSGFPGLMLKHALSDASNGVLSSFSYLETVDYGSNVPLAENFDPAVGDFDDTHGYPSCNPDQFMAWFHLPAIKSLSIWLRQFYPPIPRLSDLHTLVVARSTMAEPEIPHLFSQLPSLKTLHLGMAYRFSEQTALGESYYITEGLQSVSGSLEKLSLGIDIPQIWVTSILV